MVALLNSAAFGGPDACVVHCRSRSPLREYETPRRQPLAIEKSR
jgi:hypothetical protein